MSVLGQPVNRSYPINDDWLDQKQNDADAYVDIQEIVEMRGEYLTWLVANVPGTDPAVEQAKAFFVHSGIKVNSTGNDVNTAINCRLKNDSYNKVRHYVGKMVHPESVVRIYAKGTTAEDIEIVGY